MDRNSTTQKKNLTMTETPTTEEDSKVNQIQSTHSILEHYQTIQKPVGLYPGYVRPPLWDIYEYHYTCSLRIYNVRIMNV